MRKNVNNYFRRTYGCLCGFGTVAAKDGWYGRRQVETNCTSTGREELLGCAVFWWCVSG